MKLSILICAINGREQSCKNLIDELDRQISYYNLFNNIEILVEKDDGSITIGAKRNILKSRAIGEYICFIDDDDMVDKDYISEVYKAIMSNVDIITFKVQKYKNGILDVVFVPNLHLGNFESGNVVFLRNLLHLCPHKKSLADKISFTNKNFCEDMDYSIALSNLSPTNISLDKILYLYYYQEK